MFFSFYIDFIGLILFAFAIGDILKISRRAFSGETMNHWLLREQRHAPRVAVLFEGLWMNQIKNQWLSSSAFLILFYLMFYKVSLDLSKKETFTFKWMWTPGSMNEHRSLLHSKMPAVLSKTGYSVD